MRLGSGSQHPQLVLGHSGSGLFRKRVTLTPTEVATHKHVMGITGQGKSKFLASTFLQLINQGVAAALVDPHSDFALDVLALLVDFGLL